MIITGVFVGILGIPWYITRYRAIPKHHRITVHDVFGKPTKIDGIRTRFKTYRVAQSYIAEYQSRFPQHHFSMVSDMPGFKERKILGIF